MSDDGFDWHASELAKTNPNVQPPALPDGHSVAGEVEGKSESPELVEISTVRVLGDLAERRIEARLDAAAPDDGIETATVAAARPASRRRVAPLLLAVALLLLAAAAWALVG